MHDINPRRVRVEGYGAVRGELGRGRRATDGLRDRRSRLFRLLKQHVLAYSGARTIQLTSVDATRAIRRDAPAKSAQNDAHARRTYLGSYFIISNFFGIFFGLRRRMMNEPVAAVLTSFTRIAPAFVMPFAMTSSRGASR